MNFRKFSVCNDLRKLSRGFTWLFGVERNMQFTLSQENHTNHSRERKFQTKTNDHRLRFQGGQTATKLKYVLFPIMSNKEGREAWVRALEYSKQAAKSTYQCHFMLYFVSASVDPSSDIMGSLEHWIDGFVSQDFSCCRFHLKWMRIHGNLFRQFSLKRWLDLAPSCFQSRKIWCNIML